MIAQLAQDFRRANRARVVEILATLTSLGPARMVG
jgi:hypothetical protein